MVLIYDLSTFCILKKILKDCIHYKLILSTHFAPPLFSYPLKTSKKPFKCFHGVKKTRSMKWVSLTIIQKYMGYLSPVIHKLTDFGQLNDLSCILISGNGKHYIFEVQFANAVHFLEQLYLVLSSVCDVAKTRITCEQVGMIPSRRVFWLGGNQHFKEKSDTTEIKIK